MTWARTLTMTVARCLIAVACTGSLNRVSADDWLLLSQTESAISTRPRGINLVSRETHAVDGQIACGESDIDFRHAGVCPRECVGAGDFPHSILIPGTNASVKVGGFAKFDFIQDFNSIGSTDDFDTTTIPTSGPQKGNTRLHGRQTRLNVDPAASHGFGRCSSLRRGRFLRKRKHVSAATCLRQFGAGAGRSNVVHVHG